MNSCKWLVVGVTGVTGGGKSRLVTFLYQNLPQTTRLLRQDDYFLPEDSPLHIPCPGESGKCGQFNWDSICSVDCDKMFHDIEEITNHPPVRCRPEITFTNMNSSDHVDELSFASYDPGDAVAASPARPILLLDGFCLLDEKRVLKLTDLVFFFTLDKETCFQRRLTRTFIPPDGPDYFDVCVWPMYEQYLQRSQTEYTASTSIQYLDASSQIDDKQILDKIISLSKQS